MQLPGLYFDWSGLQHLKPFGICSQKPLKILNLLKANSLKYVFKIYDHGQTCVSVLDFLLSIIGSLHVRKGGTQCFRLF